MTRAQQGVAASRERWQAVPRTLCFVRHGDDVLLLKGAPTKRIWPNLYNGLGGHVEPGEDVYASVVREVREECGLEVRDVRLRAVTVVDAGDPSAGIIFFTFTAWSDTRAVTPSHEGALDWAPRTRLGEYALVEDLSEMLPRILALPDDAQPLFAHYSYDADEQLVIRISP
jgi:8-oxo-dGTP diphosphatase